MCNYLVWFVFDFINLITFVEAGAINKSTWSFGQIVAVTIWIPSLFEYFNSRSVSRPFWTLQKGQWADIEPCRRHGVCVSASARTALQGGKASPGDPNPNFTFVIIWSALRYIRQFKFETRPLTKYSAVEAPAELPLDDLAQLHLRAP